MTTEFNQIIAVSTIRIIVGILFFFQGYDKVFTVGMKEVTATMKASFSYNRLPEGFLSLIAFFTSWIELICGFLLILGFFKYFAAYLLCLNLVVVVWGFSMAKPMWETGHVFIRLILLIMFLLAPIEWDKISVDYLFALSKLQA
ncbi:MAG TPA: DoxX family membrane protein [Bacteroidia bacterium]|nr:DoxX family membrane protein [Bacteroidia bacterium]